MKITYGITVYWPSINGASIFAHEWANGIAKMHDVSVVTQSKENDHDWLFTPTLDSKGPVEYMDGNVRVSLIAPNRFEKKLLWPVANFHNFIKPLSSLALRSIFRKKIHTQMLGSDIAHNYFLDMDYFNSLIFEYAHSANIPYVVTPFIHALDKREVYNNFRIELMKKADAVIALTCAEKKWLSERGIKENRIHVVSGGVRLSSEYNATAFRVKYGIKGKMVLFMATKRKYKGYSYILEAMNEVWKDEPETYFVFIGQNTKESLDVFGHYRDRRVIEIVPLEPYSKEKASAFAACDIFCMPSTMESFGLVFAEAWIMSKPVIGGNCIATKELINEGVDGFTVDQDKKVIANKLLILLKDDILRKQMGEAGKKKALENFNWNKSVEQLNLVYSALN
ncbi:MAG: glycosyltransferase family 4 protein [Candidatus Omnitrophica bacterium]|nr:glycosyltransferase family 4 protein [Candidatus Omnitrophota bacterium]